MPPLDRGVCPLCGKEAAVRNNGSLREHGRPVCAGSGVASPLRASLPGVSSERWTLRYSRYGSRTDLHVTVGTTARQAVCATAVGMIVVSAGSWPELREVAADRSICAPCLIHAARWWEAEGGPSPFAEQVEP